MFLATRGNRLFQSTASCHRHTLSTRNVQCARPLTPFNKLAQINGGLRHMASSTTNSSPPPPPPPKPPHQHQQQQQQQQQQQPETPSRPEIVDSIKPPKFKKPEPSTPIFRSKKNAFTLLALALLLGIPSVLFLYQDIFNSREKRRQIEEEALDQSVQEQEKIAQERKELAAEIKDQTHPVNMLFQLKSFVQPQQNQAAEEEKGEEEDKMKPEQQSAALDHVDDHPEDPDVLVRQQSTQVSESETTPHSDQIHVQDSSTGENNIDSPQVKDSNNNNNQRCLVVATDNSAEDNLAQLPQLEILQVPDLLSHEIQLPEPPKLPDLQSLAEEVLPETSSSSSPSPPTSPSSPPAQETTEAVTNTVMETKQEKTPVVDANEALQLLRELYQLKFQELQQQNEKYVQTMRDALLAEFSTERSRLLKIIDDRERLYQQNLQNALELKDRQNVEAIQTELANLRNTKQIEMENALNEREQQMLSRFTEEKQQIGQFIESLSERLHSLEHDWNDEIPNYLDQAKRAALLASAIMKLSDIVEARNAGYTSFQPEFETVRKLGRGDEVVESITEALLSTDPRLPSVGVPSHQQLEQRFNVVRKHVMRSEYTPRDSGILGRALGVVLSTLSIPEAGLVDGETTDARIARARYFMKTQRLEDAISEIEKLPRTQGDIARDWLCDAHRRLSVMQAVQVLKMHTGSTFSEQQQQRQQTQFQ